jgi:hypothetical protein
MAPYKVPRQVEFRAHSCLRKVGKMLRKELQATKKPAARNTAPPPDQSGS